MENFNRHNKVRQSMVKKLQVARLAESIDNQAFMNMTMASFTQHESFGRASSQLNATAEAKLPKDFYERTLELGDQSKMTLRNENLALPSLA